MADDKLIVYGAPWCPDCRRAKQFLGEQRIPYSWVDIDGDEEARSYVQGVNDGKQIIPTIIFPDGSFLVEPTNAELAQKLDIAPKAQRTYYDLIVVGSGPAGLTTALYAAREGIDTLVIERSGVGGQAGVTERIDNYPGFAQGIEGAKLADQMREHAERFGVEILPAQGVTSIQTDGDYKMVTTESGDEYCAKAVLIATGSKYRRLNVPGEEDFIGAGIHFCATCDGPFYKGSKELLVIGGGNSGVEEGLFLSQLTDRITLVEFEPELRASGLLQEKIRSDSKFNILTNTQVTEFKGDGKLTTVLARNRETSETLEFHPAAAFVFIGLTPNTDFLKDTLDMDEQGLIVTDDTLQTSVPGVFAAGDVRRGSTKQLASAVGEGVTAFMMARRHLQKLGDVSEKTAAA